MLLGIFVSSCDVFARCYGDGRGDTVSSLVSQKNNILGEMESLEKQEETRALNMEENSMLINLRKSIEEIYKRE